MTSNKPLLLGFAAFSGTGKTTLLTQLIPNLRHQGYRIGVIKHSHHDFEIDYPDKDSYRLRSSGASPVMIVSPYRRALITELSPQRDTELSEALTAFPSQELDIILVEGFRHERFPKIELHRPSLGKPLLYPNDDSIIAIACDQSMTTTPDIPCLDLNQPDVIANFIINFLLSPNRDGYLLPKNEETAVGR